MTTLSPAPPSMVSLPGPPIRTSSPGPPSSVSLPSPPMRTSSPSPPLSVSWIAPAARPDASIDVVAGEGVDRQPVVGGLGAGDVHPRGQTEHRGSRSRSPATTRTSSPLVPLTMTLSGWPSPAVPPRTPARSTLTSVTSVPRQVVDGDRVGAAEGVEVDGLDVVEVHHDVADVAGEAQPRRRWRRASKISSTLRR